MTDTLHQLVTEQAEHVGTQGALFEPSETRGEVLRCDEAFEVWWQCYPKKVARTACLRKWRTMWNRAELPPLRVLLDALRDQQDSQQWAEGFIPNPHTWLNQGRWDDELAPRDPYACLSEHERRLTIESDIYRAERGDRDAGARLKAYSRRTNWRR